MKNVAVIECVTLKSKVYFGCAPGCCSPVEDPRPCSPDEQKEENDN